MALIICKKTYPSADILAAHNFNDRIRSDISTVNISSFYVRPYKTILSYSKNGFTRIADCKGSRKIILTNSIPEFYITNEY